MIPPKRGCDVFNVIFFKGVESVVAKDSLSYVSAYKWCCVWDGSLLARGCETSLLCVAWHLRQECVKKRLGHDDGLASCIPTTRAGLEAWTVKLNLKRGRAECDWATRRCSSSSEYSADMQSVFVLVSYENNLKQSWYMTNFKRAKSLYCDATVAVPCSSTSLPTIHNDIKFAHAPCLIHEISIGV